MSRIRTVVTIALIFGVPTSLLAQAIEARLPSARVNALTHALLKRNNEIGLMAAALIDTPDWQVAVNLRSSSERAINYCTAVDDLLQLHEMLANDGDRAKAREFIRREVKAYYSQLMEDEISVVDGERLRAKSSGLVRAAETLRERLRTTKDSLLAIVQP